jgi:hypothetical protein
MSYIRHRKPKEYGIDLNLSIPQTWKLVKYGRIELNILMGQCLNRRIDNMKTMKEEVKAWQNHRNNKEATINWQFTNDKQSHTHKDSILTSHNVDRTVVEPQPLSVVHYLKLTVPVARTEQ